jgi:hypothetical protein
VRQLYVPPEATTGGASQSCGGGAGRPYRLNNAFLVFSAKHRFRAALASVAARIASARSSAAMRVASVGEVSVDRVGLGVGFGAGVGNGVGVGRGVGAGASTKRISSEGSDRGPELPYSSKAVVLT